MEADPILRTTARPTLDSRRWHALGFIALAQLIVSLDATVVSIALPSAQAELGMSDMDRQWVVGAYTLAFGSLLLFGGRVADLVGHRRTFIAGLAGFAVASAAAGAAADGAVLIAARSVQGGCGAFLTPSALALVSVAFRSAQDRAKAFGIYSAVSSSGLAVGLVLGGVLTQYLDWRWAFYLSVPCALVAGAGVLALVGAPDRGREPGRLDVPGTLLATAGLVGLVLALDAVRRDGLTALTTVGSAASALVLLVAFAVVESRVSDPLLPMRVLVDRDRIGAYICAVLAVMTIFGLFIILTYYLQVVRGYSPVRNGLAFLPVVVGLAIGATQIVGRLPWIAPRTLMTSGCLIAAAGVLLLTRLSVDSPYPAVVLPAELLIGLGAGMVFAPATNLSTRGVEPRDSAVASAVLGTVQQVGASIGTVLLNSVAAGATAAYASSHLPAGAAHALDALTLRSMVHGFRSAIWWMVGILVLAAVITFLLLNPKARTEGGRP